MADGRRSPRRSRPMSTSVETKSIGPSSPEDAGAHQPRKACGLFIWDFPSAFLSRWCHRLQKGCEYEGRGGERFVRIRPGSMLQLLYPCSRYAPDKCLVCGGRYIDHLTLWWFKHMYSPLDQMMDRDLQRAITELPPEKKTDPPRADFANGPRFAFHRRYVLDAEEALRIKNKPYPMTPTETRKRLQRAFRQRYPLHPEFTDTSKGTLVKMPNSVSSFIYPQFSSSGKAPTTLVVIVREIVLTAVEQLIRLEIGDRSTLLQRMNNDGKANKRRSRYR